MGYGPDPDTKPNQTPNAAKLNSGVSRRAIRSVVYRETAQTASSGATVAAKWARRWARPDTPEVGL
jgi:hypothetical protein